MDYATTAPRFKINLEKATEPVIRWFSASTNGAVTISQEIGRFAADRTQCNIDTMLAMTANYANPAKMVEEQEQWFWGAVRDYTNETQRLLSIGNDVLQSIMQQTPSLPVKK